VFTARFGCAIYVLHAFRSKSKSDITTPKLEIDLSRRRPAKADLGRDELRTPLPMPVSMLSRELNW
jgi:phage-related protein